MRQTNNPFRGRLPALVNDRIVWPRWPVIIVLGRLERKGVKPPRLWSKAVPQSVATGWLDAHCYALPGVAQILRVRYWWARARRGVEIFLYEIGLANGNEADFLRDLRPILPSRYWLRVWREWPRIRLSQKDRFA